MQQVLRALLDLQEVDQDLHRVQAELKRLPAELARRRTELDRLAAQVAEKRQQAKTVRVRVKELEDQATMARQRQRKTENELSQSRADVQLLAFYDHQIKTLKKEVGAAEDEALRLLEEVERHEAQAAELQARVDAEEKLFAELSAGIQREIAAAEATRARLAAERQKRVSSSVPPEALSDYDRLLQARGGQALAQLDGRQCQACYMEVPTNLALRVSRGTELVRCPSCDRIFYLAD